MGDDHIGESASGVASQAGFGEIVSADFTLPATGAGFGDPVGTPGFGAPDSGDHR